MGMLVWWDSPNDCHWDVGTSWNKLSHWELEKLTESFRQPPNYYSPKNSRKIGSTFFDGNKKSGNPFHEKSDPSSLADLRLQVSDRQGQGGLRLSLEHDWGWPTGDCWSHIFLRHFEVDYVQCIMKILLFIYILRLSLYCTIYLHVSFSIGFFKPVWLLEIVSWMSLFDLSPGECTIQARPGINRSLGYHRMSSIDKLVISTLIVGHL